MADNVPITAGSGTNVSTDDAGASGHIQRMKLCYSADGDATHIPADVNGLTVKFASAPSIVLGAGSASVGTVLNVGDVDHDVANTAKVVQTGGHASPPGTPPTAVATGDRVRTWQDLNGAQIIRPRKLPTYRAVFRATARPNWLANAFTANTRKQYATIHHAASATKTVRLRRVRVSVFENTVAAYVLADLIRITTAPATGNPAITPGIAENSDSAAEVTCLALPTTAATEGTLYASHNWDLGVVAGASTVNPAHPVYSIDLLQPSADHEVKTPTIRAGVLEGWAVTLDANAATNPKAFIEIEFTEE